MSFSPFSLHLSPSPPLFSLLPPPFSLLPPAFSPLPPLSPALPPPVPRSLYTSIRDLINVYSRRSGSDNPREQNFDVNRNLLSLPAFATSLKKISLKSDFICFFHDFLHVYSPGAGADNPSGTKLCQQEHLVTLVICCKFQKHFFEV